MTMFPFGGPGLRVAPLILRFMPLIFIAVVVYVVGGNLYTWYRNETSPVEVRSATVMDKRIQVFQHGNRGMNRTYYLTFQLSSGERLELPVSWRDYEALEEGDLGLLHYQGTRFYSFQRY